MSILCNALCESTHHATAARNTRDRLLISFSPRNQSHLVADFRLVILIRRITKFDTEKVRQKTCDDLTVYKIIYSGFWKLLKRGRNYLIILARPAGLEPATPCLEGRCSIL